MKHEVASVPKMHEGKKNLRKIILFHEGISWSIRGSY
jgi:hypothetical protein